MSEDRYGVFHDRGWKYRHYQQGCPDKGPYPSREAAMEALLKELGFVCEGASQPRPPASNRPL